MRLALFIAALCGVLACCALLPGSASNDPQQSAALMDAYLIAHGMAESYVDSPDADKAVVARLDSLDSRARAAVRAMAQPTGGDAKATEEAVAALSDYAARQVTTSDQ